MAKPNPKAPLGSGGRFAARVEQGERRGLSKQAASAEAAAEGRAAYGKKKMAAMAAAGRKRAR